MFVLEGSTPPHRGELNGNACLSGQSLDSQALVEWALAVAVREPTGHRRRHHGQVTAVFARELPDDVIEVLALSRGKAGLPVDAEQALRTRKVVGRAFAQQLDPALALQATAPSALFLVDDWGQYRQARAIFVSQLSCRQERAIATA